MKWNRIHGVFGPSRILEWVFLKDRKAFAGSLARVLEWDFNRIILNHGVCVTTGGHALFKSAFQRFL